ncbi:hypothetical protein [Streptomyces sp. NPDC046821]|uniref:hypothetical protein n=1 Tax=Streptomyces sp. NPDC046821 TaxID=3154702 RepID=UPI0033C5C234
MRTAHTDHPQVAEADVSEASEFLANLPGKWSCGLEIRRKLAPLLAVAAQREGWPLGPELEAWLTKDSVGIRGPFPRVLPKRLENLPRYGAYHRTAGSAAAAPAKPVDDACPNHPHRKAVECLPCRSGENTPSATGDSALPASPEQVAAIRAQLGLGTGDRRSVQKTPHGEARARRKSAGARQASAAVEEDAARQKANALLDAAHAAEAQGVTPDRGVPLGGRSDGPGF